MPFELCNKNGTASCGYKSQPLSARQTKKSPWQYSLEVFKHTAKDFSCRAIVGGS